MLVNNASELGAIGPLIDFDVHALRTRVSRSTRARQSRSIQLAAPLLAERHGLIVNITSDAAHGAYAGWGPYGASKAALELLTRTLAVELRDRGVSAVLVDPGDMRTRMHQEAFPDEDISDRPLPDVTGPFWQWLFDQDAGWHQRRALRGAGEGRPMAAARVIDDFELPPELEAHEPPEARGLRRDDVRLLVSDLETDAIEHARFSDLPRWLSPGDLLVVNTSGTMNAALAATAADGRAFELHLSTRLPGGFWTVEVRQPGDKASLPYTEAVRARHCGCRRPDGPRCSRRIRSPARSRRGRVSVARGVGDPGRGASRISNGTAVRFVTATCRDRGRRAMYQTVFATEPGSAEMPSAGRPFTPELVTRLVSRRRPDRAAPAAYGRGQPREPRAAVRGVLPRAARRRPTVSTPRPAPAAG